MVVGKQSERQTQKKITSDRSYKRVKSGTLAQLEKALRTPRFIESFACSGVSPWHVKKGSNRLAEQACVRHRAGRFLAGCCDTLRERGIKEIAETAGVFNRADNRCSPPGYAVYLDCNSARHSTKFIGFSFHHGKLNRAVILRNFLIAAETQPWHYCELHFALGIFPQP